MNKAFNESVTLLLEEIVKLKAERDAAVADLKELSRCAACKHLTKDGMYTDLCTFCGLYPWNEIGEDETLWEWSGLSLAEKTSDKEKCPICEYDLGQCQCIYGGLGHPDRSKRRKVVFDHLYLFTEKQIKHLIWLEKYWSTSYVDEELEEVLDSLKPHKEEKHG